MFPSQSSDRWGRASRTMTQGYHPEVQRPSPLDVEAELGGGTTAGRQQWVEAGWLAYVIW